MEIAEKLRLNMGSRHYQIHFELFNLVWQKEIMHYKIAKRFVYFISLLAILLALLFAFRGSLA
jgi:hypothetical protein